MLVQSTSNTPQFNSHILSLMKQNIVTGYGAWGSLALTRTLTSGLEAITQTCVRPLILSGHDGDPFTEEMGGWSLRDYEDDILDQLPGDNVVMVLHSMLAVCGFNLAQRFPKRIKKVVLIDPPMLGRFSDIRVAMTFLGDPKRYLKPLISKTAFCPTRQAAKMMLFNDLESPHLDSITNQPASGMAIREMVTRQLPRRTIVPCALIAATQSRLHYLGPKKSWASATGSKFYTLNNSHCGILEDPMLAPMAYQAICEMS